MKTAVASIVIGFSTCMVSGQTTTSSSPTTTSLPELVSAVPACIFACLPKVGEEIGCSATDFDCICSDSASFIAHLGPCILRGSCGLDDAEEGTNLFTSICNVVSSSPPSAVVASASSIVTAAIAKASDAAASPTSTNAATSGTVSPEGLFAIIVAVLLA
ncbi:hypothetical protein F5X68DRAFT_242280 [Plectosphaerella plurivora]|uniref:CFEM domain-containing protein n=1 Tax=Plectosphaerella plurivora TaxID=936078 RepID=A0A9P8V631_9PEZI|nr:hypothetical protein F5X68DRAFT_242280 [Plectosphaerella plurivora]